MSRSNTDFSLCRVSTSTLAFVPQYPDWHFSVAHPALYCKNTYAILLCFALCFLLVSGAWPAPAAGRVTAYSRATSITTCCRSPGRRIFATVPMCNTIRGNAVPGRRLGFVVHGLWPQLDDGGHPSQCAPARPVAQDIVQRTLALIPGEGLIQHEWRDHGTCSGLSTAAYFDTVRRAYETVVIPPDLEATRPSHGREPARDRGEVCGR